MIAALATLLALCFCAPRQAVAEDGYDLWLRYREIGETTLRNQYRSHITGILVQGESKTLDAARKELARGSNGLLGQEIPFVDAVSSEGIVLAGTLRGSSVIRSLGLEAGLHSLGPEGFLIRSCRINRHACTVIAAKDDIGVLYGVFHFLRLMQTNRSIKNLDVSEAPKIQRRILNHWDNPDSSIERGYAGKSLWKWDELPGTAGPRVVDYARANASLGINGTVLNSVNSRAESLSTESLVKTAALADALRPYGVRVYLSARFSAPRELGGLATADPLSSQVVEWWQAKTQEIYRLIPDFGGFLVKADSEGQPGPQDYGRTQADGANMFARVLSPHGGIVMWRAFVYGAQLDPDRAKQAWQVFHPLDGRFDSNVLVQVKNGALDFQPREPVHPLFGSMPHTPLMMELQITQEYLGRSNYLVYLAPMWKEVLTFDTHARGKGSSVARIVDGSLYRSPVSGIAGVANTGSDRNWCGHHFAQANWYCFGRLAWNPDLGAMPIAEEWARMTFGNDPDVVKTVISLMMDSYENVVDTMTPLGLNVLCAGDHYSPAPDKRAGYHKADAVGLGYDRSSKGSDAVDQYHPPQSDLFNDASTCPEKYLLWFHHVPWGWKLQSGHTLLDELCRRYSRGAAAAVKQREIWSTLHGRIDEQRFDEIDARMQTQERDAAKWRDTCTTYFRTAAR